VPHFNGAEGIRCSKPHLGTTQPLEIYAIPTPDLLLRRHGDFLHIIQQIRFRNTFAKNSQVEVLCTTRQQRLFFVQHNLHWSSASCGKTAKPSANLQFVIKGKKNIGDCGGCSCLTFSSIHHSSCQHGQPFIEYTLENASPTTRIPASPREGSSHAGTHSYDRRTHAVF